MRIALAIDGGHMKIRDVCPGSFTSVWLCPRHVDLPPDCRKVVGDCGQQLRATSSRQTTPS
jgi:hypothetical protein